MTQPDAATIKQTQRDQWNHAAAGWRKHDERFRRMSEVVTQKMLALAGVKAGSHVLDIASGSGEPALPAAEIAGPDGFVLLTDQAEEMLTVAREKARERHLTNVDFQLADAESLDLEANTFDAALCRWGLMFMPDPGRCLMNAHTALKPSGRIAIAVWGPPAANPSIAGPMRIVMKLAGVEPPPPDSPGAFAFQDRGRLQSVLSHAGFREVVVEEVPVVMAKFDSGREYWAFQREFSGPVVGLYLKLSDELKKRADDEVATFAGNGDPDGPVELPGLSLVAAGTR